MTVVIARADSLRDASVFKKKWNPLFALVTLSVTFYAITASQVYPGTQNRPILSDEEASRYIPENYLDGWEPEEIEIPAVPDYVVKAGDSIQEVINEAILNAGANRIYISIAPGVYHETVYINSGTPLTIYGSSGSQDDVRIVQNISANTLVADYINIVNPEGNRYKEGDPAWELYSSCATLKGKVGTNCSATLWIVNDNLQLQHVSVENSAVDAQAVAVKVNSDKVHLMGNHFLGAQDTLYLESGAALHHVFAHMNLIEGDIDFIFGDAAVVFESCTIRAVNARNRQTVVLFAPNTSPTRSFGFLVVNSTITGDATYLGSNKVFFGRSWDSGVKTPADYVPGKSANGQLVIRDSKIDKVLNLNTPYTNAATSSRPFSTDISPDRNLDDNSHNRFWEYNNYGDDA